MLTTTAADAGGSEVPRVTPWSPSGLYGDGGVPGHDKLPPVIMLGGSQGHQDRGGKCVQAGFEFVYLAHALRPSVHPACTNGWPRGGI
jgi:hypothetical protein